MNKQSRTQQHGPPTLGKRPATDAPEVARRHKQTRFYLSKYQAYRSTLDLPTRLAELLWSYPFRPGHLPDLRPAESPAWERQKGDGLWSERKQLQEEALGNITAQIHAPLRRARIRTDRRGEDRMERLDAQRAKLDAKARALTEQVCAIGEQYRDKWWLTGKDGTEIDRAREEEEDLAWQLDQTRDHSWPKILKRRLKFVNQHYGPLVDCEYRDALQRVAALEPAFCQQCESFWRPLLPREAHYSRPRAGKPHPPAKAAKADLRELGIEPIDCTRLLKAWSLQDLSPAEKQP